MAYARKGLEVAFLPGGTPRKGAHFIIQNWIKLVMFHEKPLLQWVPDFKKHLVPQKPVDPPQKIWVLQKWSDLEEIFDIFGPHRNFHI